VPRDGAAAVAAIKRLQRSGEDDANARRRFVAQARALAGV